MDAISMRDQYTPEKADTYLQYVCDAWASIDEYAEWWEDLDSAQREVFIHEWAIPTERFAHLQRWALDGLLTPSQQLRYADLVRVIADKQALLNRLLAR